MTSLAEDVRSLADVRNLAGWPAIEWGMTEEEVADALEGRLTPIIPVARFASAYAPAKGVLTIEEHPFEVFPQFSLGTGELCQVLFRASDVDRDRLERISALLTAGHGRPVEQGTRRTWIGPTAAVELDTERLWLRWYPIADAEG